MCIRDSASLEPLVEELSNNVTFIYLEDIRSKISSLDKVRGLLEARIPKAFIPKTDPDDIAIMLFTSGTEGAPKGVALSHANLLSNVEQVDAHIGEFDSTFVWFNPLPIFHSFGLTGGVLLPLIKGMKTFLFPSPLQAKNIVKLIRETKSTILFVTDTFVNQYARAVSYTHHQIFYSKF